MTKNKTTKGNAAAKRIRMLQDKKLKYFMENRSGEFRMKIINSAKHAASTKEPKVRVTPRNVDQFVEDDDGA